MTIGSWHKIDDKENGTTYAIHVAEWLDDDGEPYNHIYCMESKGRAFVMVCEFRDYAEICNLSVNEHDRRNGVATDILHAVEQFIRTDIVNNIVVDVYPDAPEWLTEFYKKRNYKVRIRESEHKPSVFEL